MSATQVMELPVESGGVGARVRRREDERHLHGKGRFVADYVLPDLQEVAFLRSPLAHAAIRRVDKPARFAGQIIVRDDMSGARDIVADSSLLTYKSSTHPPLASGKVRFVGEPVAMCFAATRAEAEDIAEEVELDLDELPALASAFSACERTDVRVHDHWSDNLFLDLKADVDFDANARRASVVVKQKADLARQCMVPMEGKAVLAYWDHPHGQLVVVTSTQVPHMIRTGLAGCLNLDEAQIRVISPDVGGAFGYKCVLQQEELCIAWLALTHKRPFRFIEDRREHLIAGANTRQHHYEMTAYADEKGRLLAIDAQLLIDGGAYSAWPFTIGLETGQALGNLPGPYDFRGYRCRTRCAATNKPGFLPYRGVARTGVCFAMELTMDAIARAVGREAWEVRYENLVRGTDMPYTNVVKKHYDSGDFQASLKQAVERIDVPRWRRRQDEGEPDGRLIGVGFATFTEQSAHGTTVFASWGLPVVPGYDLATARVTADGGIELRAGIHSHGQGMETTLAQIANEVLGVPVQKIRLVHGDTALTPYSTGTYASRSIVMAGGAVAAACRELVPRLLRIGAHLLKESGDAVRFEAGRVVGASGSVTIADIADAWYLHPDALPKDVDLAGLEATQGFRPAVDTGAFSYATHAAVVAVDPRSGHIDILDYVIVEDCGTMINPMVVEGQTFGGTAQGIGTAFYEETLYDDNAQPLTSTLADYMLPGPTELPSVRIYHMETPSPHTQFGAKGVGEGGAIAPPAALFNAVNDALRPLGAIVSQTPLTPRRLLEAIKAVNALSVQARSGNGDEAAS
jgi:carbon-monoxide dehydrogenase large subunit